MFYDILSLGIPFLNNATFNHITLLLFYFNFRLGDLKVDPRTIRFVFISIVL